jgi:Holliday junction resolvase
MSDFERDIAQCLNRFFSERHIHGFAYRLKQHKFSSQYIDVLVDCLDPRYYCAIECKSIVGKKIYFTQHFHVDKKGTHQIAIITDFLKKTGRKGFLAVEFRGGSGGSNEAYLMPWDELTVRFASSPGIHADEFRTCIPLRREKGCYIVERLDSSPG